MAMTLAAGGAIAPDLRIDVIPGMSRGADGRVRGVVVARTDGAIVERVIAATPAASDGHRAPIYVLDREGTLVASESWGTRVRIFRGPGAVDALLADRRLAMHLSLPECVATVLDGEAALPPELHQGLLALAREQDALHEALTRRLEATWKSRGMAHWEARFAALRREGRGARVLVLTSRYSTFVRYAAQDLVDALAKQGHQATLFIEPDEHETLTSVAYLDAIERMDPDLIVAINFPRWAMGGAVPAGWPQVCWVQDAMQHLFMGKAVAGPLDFVVGHVYRDAMTRAGYRPEQLLDHMVCVSEAKFHAGPVTADQRERLSCDIAYVSHRSETADAFAERFFATSGFPPSARGVLDATRKRIDAIIERWPIGMAANELSAATTEMAAALGRGGDARATDILSHRFVRPYAEQRLRHQTLEWAAAMARRHGLKMRLYGKGWETHPTLAEFAAGPLVHGDDLRACYQLAAMHLHVSIEGCGHQRVAECALSGGLPLCRRSWAEMYYNNWQAARAFVLNPPPADASLVQFRWPAHVVANHPELMEIVRYRAFMNSEEYRWDHLWFDGLYAQPEAEGWKRFDTMVPPRHVRSLSIFGDPFESTFSTPEELEERLLRAVARGSWREQMVEGTARRAADCVGSRRFASRLVAFVTDAISPATAMRLPSLDAMCAEGVRAAEAVA